MVNSQDAAMNNLRNGAAWCIKNCTTHFVSVEIRR